MQNKLLPCPFCDGKVEFHAQEHHMNNFWNKNTIYCPTCDFRMEGVSRLQLFSRWNTRKPMERIVEQLKKKIHHLHNVNWNTAIEESIDIVKWEGGVDNG